mmetsp:Transcript_4069/g.9567  ORF Transcript_4069/g.9567 Transcript_4069/m.9567 type:complete len:302 (+) Transcript_4069:59-964(+)
MPKAAVKRSLSSGDCTEGQSGMISVMFFRMVFGFMPVSCASMLSTSSILAFAIAISGSSASPGSSAGSGATGPDVAGSSESAGASAAASAAFASWISFSFAATSDAPPAVTAASSKLTANFRRPLIFAYWLAVTAAWKESHIRWQVLSQTVCSLEAKLSMPPGLYWPTRLVRSSTNAGLRPVSLLSSSSARCKLLLQMDSCRRGSSGVDSPSSVSAGRASSYLFVAATTSSNSSCFRASLPWAIRDSSSAPMRPLTLSAWSAGILSAAAERDSTKPTMVFALWALRAGSFSSAARPLRGAS